MRKAIMAALALTPVLLHAQAKSPAQPVLESRLAASAEFAGAGDRAVANKPLHVSTGVVAPKLVYSTDVTLDNSSEAGYTGPRHVVVGMVVDKNGIPTDLHIVQSAGALVDKNVLAAVSQYRFAPGTVSNQPTAIPLNLDITLLSTTR